jgi:hypothetical protein
VPDVVATWSKVMNCDLSDRSTRKMLVARLKRLLASGVLAAVLAPSAWTGPAWADDWADLTSPTDNPATPGPDLYNNKRYEDGVQSMPDLVPMPLPPPAEALPVPLLGGSASEIAAAPARPSALYVSACRGPPAAV